jgi:hypothetical protein
MFKCLTGLQNQLYTGCIQSDSMGSVPSTVQSCSPSSYGSNGLLHCGQCETGRDAHEHTQLPQPHLHTHSTCPPPPRPPTHPHTLSLCEQAGQDHAVHRHHVDAALLGAAWGPHLQQSPHPYPVIPRGQLGTGGESYSSLPLHLGFLVLLACLRCTYCGSHRHKHTC